MREDIKNAIELLNDNGYIVIHINKGQMCLCDNCKLDVEECMYNSIGHACANLTCINNYIKEQIDYKSVVDNIK